MHEHRNHSARLVANVSLSAVYQAPSGTSKQLATQQQRQATAGKHSFTSTSTDQPPSNLTCVPSSTATRILHAQSQSFTTLILNPVQLRILEALTVGVRL